MNIPRYEDKTILIVEDDPVSQELLKELLVVTRAKLLFANDGVKSIEIYKQNSNIDLVLMDIQLPFISGTDAMKQIKEIDKEAIVIAQTAFAMASDKVKYLKVGFDGYISKPVLPEQLYETLNDCFVLSK